ncbi:MAG: hypothetical protein OFPII_01490 [Osedax symbiont Rs1]|nr:MAG: hypothetical protein OFPII_01490 [Osedax symbiont Rs1]
MLNRRTFIKLASICLLPLSQFSQAITPQYRAITLKLRTETQDWFANYAPIQLWASDLKQLDLQQFETVQIEVQNQLPEATSLHWHGMRVENRMDGVSGMTQAPIAAGASFNYQITARDAGTYWAHAHHQTYEQLARGLYLPLIVWEAEKYVVDQDLLMVIDDWLINADRQLDIASLANFTEWAHGGRKGNVITVNRQRDNIYHCKLGQRIRLRLLNAANSRIMTLAFPNLKVWILAKDGQPLPTPLKSDKPLTLGPAERYDLIVEIPQSIGNFPIYEVSAKQKLVVSNIVVTANDRLLQHDSEPLALPENRLPKIDKNNIVHRKKLLMEGGAMGNLQQARYQGELLSVNELVKKQQIWSFNGVANLADQPLLTAKSGEMVEIEIINQTRWPHAMHLHGHHFKADSAFYPKNIWHDTLLIEAGGTTKIMFRAGERGKWLLHCHMIEHQASGMATWIQVS